jgi:hypothetical protein
MSGIAYVSFLKRAEEKVPCPVWLSMKPRSMSLPKEHPTRSFWLNQNPLANYRTTSELPASGK